MMNQTLQKLVLLGFTDVAAAGCRALLGVDLEFYSDAEKLNYQIPARDGVSFLDIGLVSCKGGTEFDDAFSPIQIVNISSKNLSLVVVNCKPSWKVAHEVVNGLMELFAKNQVETLYILTALHCGDAGKDSVYEKAMFKEKTKDLPDPPKDMRTSDELFNKLIQFLHVEKIPTSCFIVTAKRAREGNASREDGTLGTIQALQGLAEELTGVKFNLLTSRELVYSENKEDDTTETKSMYL